MKYWQLNKMIYSSKDRGVRWSAHIGMTLANPNTCFNLLPSVEYRRWGDEDNYTEMEKQLYISFKWLFWYITFSRGWED